MPARDQFPRPVMRVAASLYANKTRPQLFEKCQYAPACQALANNNLSCGINPMHLKDSLCDIQSYDCDRFHCALPRLPADRVPRFGWKGGKPSTASIPDLDAILGHNRFTPNSGIPGRKPGRGHASQPECY